GAVLVYNRTDLEVLVKALRAKDPAMLKSMLDQDVVWHYISREQLKHHVRRVTLGVQEMFRLIHPAVEELKGPAVLDKSGVNLFKTPVDEADEAYHSDVEMQDDTLDVSLPHIMLTGQDTSTVHPPAFSLVSATMKHNTQKRQRTHLNLQYS
ncbi:hypothetical protein QTP70_004433, partial [Hemibagrus guttatus]